MKLECVNQGTLQNLQKSKIFFIFILLLRRTTFLNYLKLTLHDNRIEMRGIGRVCCTCYNVIREGKIISLEEILSMSCF